MKRHLSGGFMKFEEKRFVKLRTVADRWDYSVDTVYEFLHRGLITAWHPENQIGKQGLRIDVQSVLNLESSGIIDKKRFTE